MSKYRVTQRIPAYADGVKPRVHYIDKKEDALDIDYIKRWRTLPPKEGKFLDFFFEEEGERIILQVNTIEKGEKGSHVLAFIDLVRVTSLEDLSEGDDIYTRIDRIYKALGQPEPYKNKNKKIK